MLSNSFSSSNHNLNAYPHSRIYPDMSRYYNRSYSPAAASNSFASSVATSSYSPAAASRATASSFFNSPYQYEVNSRGYGAAGSGSFGKLHQDYYPEMSNSFAMTNRQYIRPPCNQYGYSEYPAERQSFLRKLSCKVNTFGLFLPVV